MPSQLTVSLEDIPASIPEPETVSSEGGPAAEKVAPGQAPGAVAESGSSRTARGEVAHFESADRCGRHAEEEEHEKRFLHQSISLVSLARNRHCRRFDADAPLFRSSHSPDDSVVTRAVAWRLDLLRADVLASGAWVANAVVA
jgi:hypothetical protein